MDALKIYDFLILSQLRKVSLRFGVLEGVGPRSNPGQPICFPNSAIGLKRLLRV